MNLELRRPGRYSLPCHSGGFDSEEAVCRQQLKMQDWCLSGVLDPQEFDVSPS